MSEPESSCSCDRCDNQRCHVCGMSHEDFPGWVEYDFKHDPNISFRLCSSECGRILFLTFEQGNN